MNGPAAVRLDNGIRVLAVAAPGTAVVASCLHLAGGTRAEPVPGLAHLTEHLLGLSEFDVDDPGATIASVGGSFTARTADDYLQFQHMVPGRELVPRLLDVVRRQLERPDPTGQEITGQLRVITAEAVRAVHQRPHGGLVTIQLPRLLFDRFANAHDGQTDISRLAELDPAVIARHLRAATRPAAVTVTLVGDADPAELVEAANAALGGLTDLAGTDPADVADGDRTEPPLTAGRSATRGDRLATGARTALGFRVPDPLRRPRAYLAVALLSEVLAHAPELLGDLGPTRTRVGRNGNPFDVLAPSMFAAEHSHPAHTPGAAVEKAFRSALGALAADPGRLAPALAGAVRALHRQLAAEAEAPRSLASWLSTGLTVHGDSGHLLALPGRLREVTAGDVAEAAAVLATAPAARITSEPEAPV